MEILAPINLYTSILCSENILNYIYSIYYKPWEHVSELRIIIERNHFCLIKCVQIMTTECVIKCLIKLIP